jgi:DNA-binding IclR family transcriptional regulator
VPAASVPHFEWMLDFANDRGVESPVVTVKQRKRAYHSRAVERAFDVLTVLADEPGGATLAELTRATGVPGSTLLGILGSLRDRKTVKDDGKRYMLDVGVLQLGQAYSAGVDVAATFAPIGRRLRAVLDETVQLGVLSGGEAVYIARHESTQPVRLVALVGRRLPAHASAVGKALLAQLDDAELPSLLGEEPLARLADNTITTYAELRRDLGAIRERGYAESREECISGLHCMSAPVFDHSGRAVAAISVSAPRFRMDRARRSRVAVEVVGAAREMSQALGAPASVAGRRS